VKPKNIFLIRHGQSIGNVDKSIYCAVPDYAVKLTDKGKEQAREVGEFLKSGYNNFQFYVSSYHRTRQTFQEIKNVFENNNINFSFYEDIRLREQEWSGNLRPEDIDFDKIQEERDKYGSFYYRFNGGEACSSVYDRVSDFMNTLHRDFKKENFPENVGIVTHGMTMRVFIMRWFHFSVEEFELLKNPKNCGIFHLFLENNKYKIKGYLEKHDKPLHPYQLPIV